MNRLTGRITSIEQSGGIMLVDIDATGSHFSALMINTQELPAWLNAGNSIRIIFKETEVSIVKNFSGQLSEPNILSCVVSNVRRGDILSIVEMTSGGHAITSAITTRSADRLQLRTHDIVTAFIKANEITLSEMKE